MDRSCSGSNTSALVGKKKDNLELGKQEHILDVCKDIAESNYRHNARDFLRHHEHLHKGKDVSHHSHDSMDADDEAELNDTEPCEVIIHETPRPHGIKGLSFKESASLKPTKHKKAVRSRLFDYKSSQGRSRRQLSVDADVESSGTRGSGSIGLGHKPSRERSLRSLANGSSGGSLLAIHRPQHGAGSKKLSGDQDSSWQVITSHDLAMHLLNSDHNHHDVGHPRRPSVGSTASDSDSEAGRRRRMISLEFSPSGSSRRLYGRVPSGTASSSSSGHGSITKMAPHGHLVDHKNGNGSHGRPAKRGTKRSKPTEEKETHLARRRLSGQSESNHKPHGRFPEAIHRDEQTKEKSSANGRRRSKAAAQHISLTPEAMEEFKHLINDPSFSPEYQLIPDVAGPVCSRDEKTQRRMMALELLLKQIPSIKQQLQEPATRFDPYEMLSCRYLRLSANNVKTLEEMCREAGLDVDYHPHMDSSDPKLQLPKIPRRQVSPLATGLETTPPTSVRDPVKRKKLPNGE